MNLLVFTDFDDTLHNYTAFLASFLQLDYYPYKLCKVFNKAPDYVNYPDYETFIRFINGGIINWIQTKMKLANFSSIDWIVVSSRYNAQNDFTYFERFVKETFDLQVNLQFTIMSNLQRVMKIYDWAVTNLHGNFMLVVSDDNPFVAGAYYDLETQFDDKVSVLVPDKVYTALKLHSDEVTRALYGLSSTSKVLHTDFCTEYDCFKILYEHGLLPQDRLAYRFLYPTLLSENFEVANTILKSYIQSETAEVLETYNKHLLKSMYLVTTGSYLCNAF